VKGRKKERKSHEIKKERDRDRDTKSKGGEKMFMKEKERTHTQQIKSERGEKGFERKRKEGKDRGDIKREIEDEQCPREREKKRYKEKEDI
jgi:hypothetical protein